jgi:hypothetical protein
VAERWVNALNLTGKRPDVEAFLDEIDAVCLRHGMSISFFDAEECTRQNADAHCAALAPPHPAHRRTTIDGQRAILYWDTFAWVAQGVAVDVVGQGDTEREAVESFRRSLAEEWRMRPAPPPMPELLEALWAGLPEWDGER